MTFCPDCKTKVVVDPPIRVFEDFFHPQLVQIIHPVEIINRHHCVPVFQHLFTFNVKDECCNISELASKKKRGAKVSKR